MFIDGKFFYQTTIFLSGEKIVCYLKEIYHEV